MAETNKLYQQDNCIQFAIDKNNNLYIRTWGSGYQGHGAWGCWYPIDCSFKNLRKLDGSRIKSPSNASSKYDPLPADFVDTLDTIINLYN